MAQELSTAMKTAKEIERSLVQNENRLAYIQDEVKRLTGTRDSMQAEIDKKTADYNIYIAQRDTDSKKMRADILAEHDQLNKDKKEFQGILQQFQKEKQVHLESVQGFDVNKKRNEDQMNNIREFVIAVQRACSLLGL